MGGFDANKDIYLYIYMALKKTIYYIYCIYILLNILMNRGIH